MDMQCTFSLAYLTVYKSIVGSAGGSEDSVPTGPWKVDLYGQTSFLDLKEFFSVHSTKIKAHTTTYQSSSGQRLWPCNGSVGTYPPLEFNVACAHVLHVLNLCYLSLLLDATRRI